MATINIYLTFNGNCEEAFNFYKSVFGGEFNSINRYSEMPAQEGMTLVEADKNKIMHIGLPISKETILMGADNTQSYESHTTFGNNFSIMASGSSKEDADRIFSVLSAGGKITMPIQDQFWGDYMGALVDKYGINWLVSYDPSNKPRMTPEKLSIKAAMQIQRSAHEVFEAIVDPEKMSNYFISKGSARMEEGKTLTWRFPEFDSETPVRVGRIEKNKFISFIWDDEAGNELFVEMQLDSQPDGSTIVRIKEGEMLNDEAGIRWLIGNTEGWANFLACLKVWMEYGINLRKGAFEFMGGD